MIRCHCSATARCARHPAAQGDLEGAEIQLLKARRMQQPVEQGVDPGHHRKLDLAQFL